MNYFELTDRLTRPLRAAGRQVQGFAATSRGAFRDIATGGAALWGVGAAIQGALMPAIEMDRALGEVKSLGVAESGLRKLSRAAVDFTMEYGGLRRILCVLLTTSSQPLPVN
ncbi:hypothetical protein [Escherichia coli]|uniref:hypothetical protein n=1 Tax=Escherichia coli TaxID=562 RepID=UPI002FCCC904